MALVSLRIFLLVILPIVITSENVFKIDIEPAEAQQYLHNANALDIDNIEYSPKIGENPVPEQRNERGQFVYMGRVLEHPDDYVEEHYDARQYQGQDGTGQYAYGYRDWNQGKKELKDDTGKIRGSYKYVQPNGRDFVANYFTDETGAFHVEDNRPPHLKMPATKTPDVIKAEAEHFRLWGELAAAAGRNPDPFAPEYQQSEHNQYEPSESQAIRNVHQPVEYVPGAEEGGPPRGFFYDFTYETPLLRNKNERAQQQQLQANSNHQ